MMAMLASRGVLGWVLDQPFHTLKKMRKKIYLPISRITDSYHWVLGQDLQCIFPIYLKHWPSRYLNLQETIPCLQLVLGKDAELSFRICHRLQKIGYLPG